MNQVVINIKKIIHVDDYLRSVFHTHLTPQKIFLLFASMQKHFAFLYT